MKKYIRTLTIYYDNEITNQEIPLFRGAIINMIGKDANLLFHNHIGESSFRYSYPLIQYKRIKGKAAIVCVEEGADTIGQFLTKNDEPIRIGNRTIQLTISRIVPSRILVQTWDKPFCYYIHDWLPLNKDNYTAFKTIEEDSARITFLSNIMKSNILSMLKGLHITLEDKLLVEIKKLSDTHIIHHKGILMTSFNSQFSCNLSIPNNLGIGKSPSLGFGTIHQRRERDQDTGMMPATEGYIFSEE